MQGDRKFNFNRVVSFVNDSFIYPLALMVLITFISITYKNTTVETIMNWLLTVIVTIWLVYFAILLFKRVSISDIKLFFTIAFVCISIALMINKTQGKYADVLFVVGIISLELHLIYEVIYGVRLSKLSTFKVLFYTFLFIFIGYSTIYVYTYNKANPQENEFFNSLVTMFSAIVGGGLTLGGVAWTIRHEKEEKRREEQQKLLSTCSMLSFNKIDLINYDGSTLCLSYPIPNALCYKDCLESDLTGNHNILMRFVLNSNSNIPVKNININSIHIYPSYKDGMSMSKEYCFYNKFGILQECNVSLLDLNSYQVCAHLITDANSCVLKELIDSFLKSTNESLVFMTVEYTVTNMNNVRYSASLRFMCKIYLTIDNELPKFDISDYQYISNWIIEEPKIVE